MIRDVRAYQHAIQFVEEAKSALAEEGLLVEFKTDFSQFLDEASKTNRVLAPHHFSPSAIPLLSQKAFWLHGTDEAGETVHIQAMRLDDCGCASLDEFCKDFWPSIDRGRIGTPSPLMKAISGKAVYSGGAWVADSFRKKNVAPWACRLMHAMALLLWWPDWIYGLIDVRAVDYGHARHWGFTQIQPAVNDWAEKPPHNWDFNLVANTREDLINMVQTGHEGYARRPKLTPQSHVQAVRTA